MKVNRGERPADGGTNVFAVQAKHIVEFDGDTIYAAAQDAKKGVGIDMYASELVNERRYSFDSWNA
jgi:hypothetical protein